MANFNSIDWNVLKVDASSPEVLAQKLTTPYTTDIEKVRSIFRWITEHIDYNTVIYNRYQRTARKNIINDDDDTSAILKPLNERVANIVLKRRLAVCDGYARLFKTLCDYAGLKSEVITGYARTGSETSFRSNHTWNAVFIDSNWHLLDVTWASGYISFWGYEFVRKYNDFYFLTAPKEFIKDHYPEDLQWTLLDDPPTQREYTQSPFKHSSFVKYKITSFKPATGIVEAAVGDTLQFELLVRDLDVATSPDQKFCIDSISQNGSKMAFVEPHLTSKQKIVFQYIVQPTVSWLHLVHDENIILRYRIKMKEALAVNH